MAHQREDLGLSWRQGREIPMDRGLGALDTRAGEQVMDLLLDLNQIGQTLLLMTHDQQLATRCASRVIEFVDGQIAGERCLERTS